MRPTGTTLVAALAALALVAGPAAAQQGQSPSPTGSPPASSQPSYGSGQDRPAAQPGQASPGAPAGQSSAGQPSASQPAASNVQIDSAALVGSTVRSSDGRDVGKVDRLMLDPKDGRVATVVIKRGGTLGMGGETLSVPWDAVQVRQDDRNVVLTIDQQMLEKAPAASPRTGNDKNGKGEGQQPKR